jgi:moderate conductance mechanosensitive channel
MFLSFVEPYSSLAMRWAAIEQGHFLGKVLDEWTADSQEFLHTKLPRIIVIAAIAFLLNRLLQVITHRMVRVAEQHADGPARLGEVKTLVGVIRATGLAIIGLIAGLQLLDALGFDLAPLLASAGVAGIAIGLAAQNIVKDMFNGFLILVEGQFSVGDTIKVAGVTGVVESLTLRKTTIRDGNDGTLYVIPNSQITTVGNQSSDFSLANLHVSVDFSANPDEVTAMLKKIAMEVRNMPSFQDVFKSDPQILGVDSLKGSQQIFLVVFKTLPTQQYAPMREFQRRVRLALEENHLLPGDPNRVFNPLISPAPTAHQNSDPEPESKVVDPTTLKPPETSLFGS